MPNPVEGTALWLIWKRGVDLVEASVTVRNEFSTGQQFTSSQASTRSFFSFSDNVPFKNNDEISVC
jgi:hypothetical protein